MTSKAGLRTGVSGSASAAPPAWRTSSGARSSMAIPAPVGIVGSIEEVGPATTNGMPAAAAAPPWP